MAIFKCKMCGGTIEFEPGATVGVCDSCGTKQTLPRLDSDRKSNLYDRANHFRRNNDFDKAMGIYEQILNEDNTDAEAYWSLVLCRYGIEYVEDPITHKRIPTVNRAQYTSIYMDEDYKAALQYSDVYQRQVYEEEAKAIDDIQRGILEISNREKPFDVFICYKETDDNGRRTVDSVLANDLYHQLIQEGFKVFFSRITLEDKLGTAYEPFIFAALNSAKVMVVLGTKPEYFNAVWVRNEWSRYLALVKQSRGKKLLIPAYRDMDPYDLPEEFSHLQAQDMSKLGFMQDLIRGIKKIIGPDPTQQSAQQSVGSTVSAYSSNVDALLKRGNMALEDHEWKKADDFFEEVLNQNAECSAAYLGKWMVAEKQPNLATLFTELVNRYSKWKIKIYDACPADENHITYMINQNQIPNYLDGITIEQQYSFDRTFRSEVESRQTQKEKLLAMLSSEKLFARALQYAQGTEKEQLKQKVTNLLQFMDDQIDEAKRDEAEKVNRIRAAYQEHLKKADQKVLELKRKAEAQKREDVYQYYSNLMKEAKTIAEFQTIKDNLSLLYDYKDSRIIVDKCQNEIKLIQEKQRRNEIKETKKRKIILKVIIPSISIAIVLGIGFIIIITTIILPRRTHKKFTDELEALQSAPVGSVVQYGVFDDYRMKWIVLAREGNRILLCKQTALIKKAYHTTRTCVSWETCSLREWLNTEFINTAFSEDELVIIDNVQDSASLKFQHNDSSEDENEDKVFLLTAEEVYRYFRSDQERICYYNGEVCWWWIQSTSDDSGLIAYITSDGTINSDGIYVTGDHGAVRPAIWIDLGE